MGWVPSLAWGNFMSQSELHEAQRPRGAPTGLGTMWGSPAGSGPFGSPPRLRSAPARSSSRGTRSAPPAAPSSPTRGTELTGSGDGGPAFRARGILGIAGRPRKSGGRTTSPKMPCGLLTPPPATVSLRLLPPGQGGADSPRDAALWLLDSGRAERRRGDGAGPAHQETR